MWGRSLQGPAGRLLFAAVRAALGGALLHVTIDSMALIGAASGGTAGWLVGSPDWTPRWRTGLVWAAGLVAGIIMGAQYS